MIRIFIKKLFFLQNDIIDSGLQQQQPQHHHHHHHHQQHQQQPQQPQHVQMTQQQQHIFNENFTPSMKLNQEKTTYGRLRVLTAPPTSVHELGASETASPRDLEGSPFSFDVNKGASEPRRPVAAVNSSNSGGGAVSTGGGSGGSSGRRGNLRPSSGTGSTQRLSGCGGGVNRDHSVTQFALIDDENVSALQQVV